LCAGIKEIYIYAVLPPLTCAVNSHLFCNINIFTSCCLTTCRTTDGQTGHCVWPPEDNNYAIISW